MRRLLKILKYFSFSIASIILLLLILIQFAGVQRRIAILVKEKVFAENGLSDIQFERIKIGLTGKLSLYELSVPGDINGQLIGIDKLQAKVSIAALLRKNLFLKSVLLKGTSGQIYRYRNDSFNFSSFIPEKPDFDSTKKNTGGNFEFEVGNVQLEDVLFRYHDSLSQVFLDVDLGYFNTNLYGSDIPNLGFQFDKIVLESTHVLLGIDSSLVQSEVVEETENIALPIINAGLLKLTDVSFRLNDLSKSSYLEAKVIKMTSKGILVDIGREQVDVKYMELKNSNYTMDYQADTIQSDKPVAVAVDEVQHINFSGGWTINADEVKGKNVSVLLQLEELKDSLKVFHGTNFGFENIDFLIVKTSVQSDQIKSNIKSLSCTDINKFKLSDAAIDFRMNQNLGYFNINTLKTLSSEIKAEIDIDFPLASPDLKQLIVRKFLVKGSLSPDEVAYFMPVFSNIESFKEQQELDITVDVSGNEKDIIVHSVELSTPEFLFVKGGGEISSYNNLAELRYAIWLDTLEIESISELQLFQSDVFREDLPVIRSKLKVSGTADSLGANVILSDKESNIRAKVSAKNDSTNWNVESLLTIDRIDLSDYLFDTLLGELSAEINIGIVAEDYDSISTIILAGELYTFQAGPTNFNDLKINGKYKDDSLFFQAGHDSNGLIFIAETEGLFSNDTLDLKYQIRIDSLNPKDYILTKEELNITGEIAGKLNFKTKENLILSGDFNNLKFNYADEEYMFDRLLCNYQIKNDSEFGEFETEGIKIWSKKNISVDSVKAETRRFIKHTFNPEAEYIPDKEDELTLKCSISRPLALQRILGNTFLDTLIIEWINIDYDLQENKFDLDLNIPHFGYKGVALKDLKTNISIDKNDFISRVILDQILFQDIKSNSFEFNAYNNTKGINSSLRLFDGGGQVAANIPVLMSQVDSVIKFRLNPDSILISQQLWKTSDEVAIQYDFKNKEWSSSGLEVYHNDQAIEFSETANEVSIKLKNLNLEKSSHFFTLSDTNFVTKGRLSANVSLINLDSEQSLIKAQANIQGVNIADVPYGDLQLDFNQISDYNFKVGLSLINKEDFIKYNGSFGSLSAKQHSGKVYISDLSVYTALIDTTIINLKEGGLKSELQATTKRDSFKLGGFIQANNTLIQIPQIGAQFRIVDERFSFDEKGIHFSKTNIEDLGGNKLNINGDIFTTDYKDFRFGLSVNSNYFQLLNSTKDQNENFFGKLIVSAKLDLKGTHNAPILQADIKVHEKTDITVVLPGDDPLQSGTDDVVRFAQATDSDVDSLYITNSIATVSDSIESIIRQGSLNVVLTFSPLARYKVITNPVSGDYAYFGLSGAIAYRTLQKGLTELSGNIQIVDGLYAMSFYEMIKKEFTIEPQSTIYFSGPVSNTTLDLSAKNIVRTNSLALMSSESIGNSAEEKALYNQRLPYELYFNVGGLLLSPEVSFALDLPDEYKQNSPMIASKINKLSSPEMEQERNMQVFALLVTGGFIAENTGVTSGSGSSDVAAATARNSVNSILSQQLNKLTSDNIQAFDMNLGLNTYEDYARRGGSTTTDLDVQISKSLFDDKVSFEMESRINLDGSSTTTQSSSNYNTDYKLFYTLNENETFKAKAYNLSIYDLFDGDITNTGLGIVFSKDFEGKKKRNYVEVDSTQKHE